LKQQLTGERTSKQNAVNYLDSYFGKTTKRNKRDQFVIMLVDELDLLCTKRQNILYHLFDWPNRQNSRLVILSIANTMDLPERMMMNRVSSRIGLTRLTFQPYSYTQLQEIVNARVQCLALFDQDGVQLIARKVAAISGDARRVLDICRRAVDVAETQFEAIRPGMQCKQQVTLLNVNQALKDIFSSEKLTAITQASEQQRLLLQAIVQDFRITGLEEAVFRDVYAHHVSISHFSNALAPSPSELLQIAYELHEIKLILIDKNRVDMLKRIRLNVSVDDINFGLQSKAD
jgi:origin recognition complex subunit 1